MTPLARPSNTIKPLEMKDVVKIHPVLGLEDFKREVLRCTLIIKVEKVRLWPSYLLGHCNMTLA